MEKRLAPQLSRLMVQVREVLRYHHYVLSTERSYVSLILNYIRFHRRRHPRKLELIDGF